MNAREFNKQRGRIDYTHRGDAWRKRATEHLVRKAQAVAVLCNRRVIAYQLPNGETVCVKQRFNSQAAAELTLRMIVLEHQPRGSVPIRAYLCGHCKGWHVTSMA